MPVLNRASFLVIVINQVPVNNIEHDIFLDVFSRSSLQ